MIITLKIKITIKKMCFSNVCIRAHLFNSLYRQVLKSMLTKRGLQLLPVALAFFISVAHSRNPRKIVDGENAWILEFPYQVFLEILEDIGFAACGGTILDHWHILTAAHCLYHGDVLIPPENFTIITGTDDLRYRPPGNLFKVSEITPHPNYNRTGTMENDIGILKVKRLILFNKRRKPAKFPTERITRGTEVTTTGWGSRSINYTGEPYPHLQKFKSNVISFTQCRARAPLWKVRSTQICAVGQKGASCDGDSGSPLSYNGVVVGIDSLGTCDRDDPTIYTCVHKYLPWIRSIIGSRTREIYHRPHQ